MSYCEAHQKAPERGYTSCPSCEIARLRRQRDEAMRLLAILTNHHDEPCRLDHHGLCQTHLLEDDCTVATAKELIRRVPEGAL